MSNDDSAGEHHSTRHTADWRKLHLWQIQPVRDALLIAAVVGIIWLGYRLSVVTVPLLLAMALAYLFEPLARRMTRGRWMSRQGFALGVISLAAVVVITPAIFGLGFAVLQGVSYARGFIRNVQTLQASVEKPLDQELRLAVPDGGWRGIRDYVVEAQTEEPSPRADPPSEPTSPPSSEPDPPPTDQADQDADAASSAGPGAETDAPSAPGVETVEQFIAPVRERTRDLVRETTAWVFHLLQTNADTIGRFVGRQAIGGGADAARAALNTFTNLGFLVFTGFLTAFFFYFFCTGYGRVLAFWESLIPERRKGRIFDLLGQMDRVIAGFVRGRLTICAVLMVYFTIAYWFIGTPAPLILGPIVGVLALLPYMAGLGMPIAMLLMWLQPAAAGWQGEWWWIVGAPILVSIGSQIVDDYILTPMIQGKSTGMDTPTIVFASIAGGALAGVYGLLLAIPAAACIKILLREVVWPRVKDWASGKTSDPLPIDPAETTPRR